MRNNPTCAEWRSGENAMTIRLDRATKELILLIPCKANRVGSNPASAQVGNFKEKKMIHFELTIKNPKDLTKMLIIEGNDYNSIWISKGDGEGGEFNLQSFYDVIEKFYNDNF